MNWKSEAEMVRAKNPKHILFLCVANSARSQMAEGIARSLAPSSIKISSAGSKPTTVHPLAIEVLAEINIDIRSQISKSVEMIDSSTVDTVITLCADEVCPHFPSSATKLHWALDNPITTIESFRAIRDELMLRLNYLFKNWNMQKNELIKNAVRENYSLVAGRAQSSGCGCSPSSSCCGPAQKSSKDASIELGYGHDDIEKVPSASNMGLGCGNPKTFSSLKKGEIVLDLGSGGGFDCFIAAQEVGDSGLVIGVDMTPAMVSKARLNADQGQYRNVEFRLGEIEHLPVSDSSIDVIISNCVINLSTDKKQVFKEAFRVLKKGGRLAISDVVKTAELPPEVEGQMEAYSACVSGAIPIQEIQAILKEVGFVKIKLSPKNESQVFIKNWLPGSNVEDYIQSATIEAVKG